MLRHFLLSITSLLFVLTSDVFAQQVVEWNYNNRAKALGSGCSRGDTDFIRAGNEVSVVFSRLGVDLTGYANGRRVAKKTCRIIIPTKVRAGYYLAELQQTLTYGYNRTEDTNGKVVAATSFYNQSAGRLQRRIPTPGLDPWDEPFASIYHSSVWQVRPGWCLRRDYKGNFKANLAVTGYRRSTDKDIVIQIDGHDIRFDALGVPALCPR